MIVMKFGGSSLESAEAIRRVCGIVHTHLRSHPVVVVSALGKTTDRLVEMAREAAKGRGFEARKLLNEVQDTHFGIAGELLSKQRVEEVEKSFRNAFRELFGVIHDLSEDGRALTAEFSDYVVSFGERLSSELVAAALPEAGVPAAHLDARQMILTDNHFGAATPLLWETYARVRRAIAQTDSGVVAVLGGFIAATEDGSTTTLGRGGSDLTASLVGAALSVDEIQIWTDVDGILTCDPRVYGGGHRLRQISYAEASTMAGAGAKVLHPDSVRPAVRQQIPLVIRNSRRPQCEGTRIVPAVAPSGNRVKGIAVIQNLLLMAIRRPDVGDSSAPGALQEFLKRKSVGAAFIKRTDGLVYIGFPNTCLLREIEMEMNGCVQGQVMMNYSVITLVGAGLGNERGVAERAVSAVKGMNPIVFPGDEGDNSIGLAIPQRQTRRACMLLHREFFSHVDVRLFAAAAVEMVTDVVVEDALVSYAMRKTRMLARVNVFAR